MALGKASTGPSDIYALCLAREVLTKGSAAKIAESPIKEMVLTDTIGYRAEPPPRTATVVSVAALFAEAILLDPPHGRA